MRNFTHFLIILVATISTLAFQVSLVRASDDSHPPKPIPQQGGNATPQNLNTESAAWPNASPAASSNSCRDASEDASASCQGFDTTEIMASMAAQQAAGSLSQVGGKAACVSQLAVTGVQSTYGVMRITKCNNAYNSCNRACDNERAEMQCSGNNAGSPVCRRLDAYKKRCSEFRTIGAIVGGSNIATGALSGVAAKMCKDQLDAENNKCKGDNAKRNQFCPNFCSFPENQTANSWCLMAECSDPTKARANPSCGPAYCYQFIGNPNPPAACSYLAGAPTPVPVDNPTAPNIATAPNFPLPPGLEEGDMPYDENIPRVEGSGKGTGIGEFAAGSGMGGGGNGSSGFGGANNNGQGGSGRGPFDTNIDKGFQGSGSGGGYSASGVSTDSNGAGARGGGSAGADSKDNFDLSKFLPGGEQGGSRNPASVDLVAQGITGANDISNFEKISRKMNQKRPLMKNPEGK